MDGGMSAVAVAVVKAAPTVLSGILAAIRQVEDDNRVVLKWKERPLRGYQFQLEELESIAVGIENEGLKRYLAQLNGHMQTHLEALKKFCADEDNANSKPMVVCVWCAIKEIFGRTRRESMDTLKANEKDLMESIDQAHKLMKLAIAEDDKRKAQEAEWGTIVAGPKGLEKRHVSIQQIIDDLRDKHKKARGDGFAVLMFLEDPEKAGKDQKALEGYWREVQGYFKTKKWAPKEAAFFTGNWLNRARLARQFGEPLDIANWYYKNKHVDNAKAGRPCHYINGLFVSEYVYESGLQAAAGRLRSALEQLLQQAPQPWSGSMLEVKALRRALRRVKHLEAVRAVEPAVEALEEARRSSKRAGDSTKRDQLQKGRASEDKAAKDLAETVGVLKRCTASLHRHATEAVALMARVQGEALQAPHAAAWDDVLAAPDQALGEGLAGHQNKRAAAGAHELARWVGWRAEELTVAAAAVDAALAGVEAAVAARQQDVIVLASVAVLAAAAGGDVRVVGPRDNSCRPGRYQVFQKHERRALVQETGPLREPPTSLGLARKLQWLGSGADAVRFEEVHRWPACLRSLLPRPGVSPLPP